MLWKLWTFQQQQKHYFRAITIAEQYKKAICINILPLWNKHWILFNAQFSEDTFNLWLLFFLMAPRMVEKSEHFFDGTTFPTYIALECWYCTTHSLTQVINKHRHVITCFAANAAFSLPQARAFLLEEIW